MSPYEVQTEIFQGPLDLLLSLIEKRKMHINDVSLSRVADDFLAHIKKREELPIGETAHFILIASTLVLIKSRSLLPTLKLTVEEEASIDDLEERLRLYSHIREVSKHLQYQFGARRIFLKTPEKIVRHTPVFSPSQKMNIINLRSAIQTLIANLPSKDFIPRVLIKKVISLEDMMNELTTRVQKNLQTTFSEFTKTNGMSALSRHQKINVIVGFLAMLELVKRGIIDVTQNKHFHDIDIESQTIEVPRYG